MREEAEAEFSGVNSMRKRQVAGVSTSISSVSSHFIDCSGAFQSVN